MTTTQTRHANNYERALGVAHEYRTLVGRGDVVLAEQAARTISNLVGSYVWDATRGSYTYTLPPSIVAEMGRAHGK